MSVSNFIKKIFGKQSNKVSYPTIQHKFPAVSLRPWGGEDATRLMIELNPIDFYDGKVGVAIEKGYVDTGKHEPPQWVESNCSGLKYVDHHEVNGIVFITMKIDPHAVKPDSEYPYLISGDGGGEYSVAVFRLVEGKDPECLFDRCFCCK